MTAQSDNAAYDRYQMLPALKETCIKCRMCDLGFNKVRDRYDPHVFNYEPLYSQPKFMIVGQNPGWREVVEGKSFVGDAGKNFDKIMDKILWDRKDFYITNSIKCFIDQNKQPTEDEKSKCEPFLKMEIEIIKPILIVALGDVAFSMLCSNHKFADCVGKITNSIKYGVKVFATYYPSSRNMYISEYKKQFRKDIEMLGKIMDNYLTPF